MTDLISPDAMIAAAAHVQREYGVTGYAIGVESGSQFGKCIFLARHFDGSEFRLIADRWGNVDRLPDDWPTLTIAMQIAAVEACDAARDARLAANA